MLFCRVIVSVEAGHKPRGFPIFGDGARKTFTCNMNYFIGWTKYSIPYPALGFEVHYSVNETNRWYSDVKVKNIFIGN